MLKKTYLSYLISTIISLYLVEGFLTYNFIYKKNSNSKITNNKEFKFERKTLLEFLDSYKSNNKNENIVPYFTSQNLIKKNIPLLPLSGISNSITVHCNESGFYSIYSSDRYGFNNPDYIWDSRKKKILLLGDSFVHGSCVNFDKTISGNMMQKLKNYEVYNLGYSGNGPLKQYAILKEYSKINNINFIIWFYFEDNELLEDIETELSNPILKKYLENENFTQQLVLKQKIIDNMYLDFLNNKSKLQSLDTRGLNTNEDIRELKLFEFIKFTKLRTIFIDLKRLKVKQENLKIYSNILDKVNYISKKNNSELIFVYLPSILRYHNKFLNNNLLYSKYSIKNMVENKKIKFLDFNEILNKQNNPLNYFALYGAHYNDKGYALLSNYIISNLN